MGNLNFNKDGARSCVDSLNGLYEEYSNNLNSLAQEYDNLFSGSMWTGPLSNSFASLSENIMEDIRTCSLYINKSASDLNSILNQYIKIDER